MISWPRPEPDQQAGDRQLGLGVGGAHLRAQLRQRGQVGVDRQRPDRAQRAEHENELDIAAADELFTQRARRGVVGACEACVGLDQRGHSESVLTETKVDVGHDVVAETCRAAGVRTLHSRQPGSSPRYSLL